jgi:hypothetical protein
MNTFHFIGLVGGAGAPESWGGRIIFFGGDGVASPQITDAMEGGALPCSRLSELLPASRPVGRMASSPGRKPARCALWAILDVLPRHRPAARLSPPWIPAHSAARSSDELYQKQLALGLQDVARASRFPSRRILLAGGLRGLAHRKTVVSAKPNARIKQRFHSREHQIPVHRDPGHSESPGKPDWEKPAEHLAIQALTSEGQSHHQ